MANPAGIPKTPTTPAGKGTNDPMGPLRNAARAGDWTRVFELIDREGGDVNAPLGSRGRSLMQRAAYHGDLPLMKRLKSHGAKTHGFADSEGMSVIQSAVAGATVRTSVKIDMLDWLKSQGADLSQRSGSNDASLLHQAAQKQDLLLLDYLLEVGVDPNIQDKNGNTPLFLLAERNPNGASRGVVHRMMHRLIDEGANINHVNKAGQTPVLVSLRYDSFQPNADLLLDAGAVLDNPRMPHSLEIMLKSHNRSASDGYPYAGYPGGSGTLNDKTLQYVNRRRTLPTIDLTTYFRKEALFTPNAFGFTPLDNPKTWQQIGAIGEVLARRRDPLTRDDLLKLNPATKKPYLQRAIECRSLHHVLPVLDVSGESVKPQDFAAGEKGDKLSPLGQAAYESGTMQREIFTKQNWADKTVKAMRDFYQQLPPVLQAQVENLHQLSVALKRQQERNFSLEQAKAV